MEGAKNPLFATVFGPGRFVIKLLPIIFKIKLTKPRLGDSVGLPTTKGYPMSVTFEFSDGFDAVGFYMEQMERNEDWDYYHAQWD